MTKPLLLNNPIGLRLRKLRKATGLSRQEIEKRYHIKSSSLRSWESESRLLKQHKAELLAAIYQEYGISCSADWILRGEGRDPLESGDQTAEEDYILKETKRFASFYSNSIVLQATDYYMAPWIQKSDWVGGVFCDLQKPEDFTDHPCIVKTREFGTQIRLVQQIESETLYNLISFSGKGNLSQVEIESVAPIIFLRKQSETKS